MSRLTKAEREGKLAKLVEGEGFENVDALLEACASDSVCPAICINPGCTYTEEMEPDQSEGWCDACGTNSMRSVLILAEMI